MDYETYKTPTMKSLLEEAKNHLDPFNNNEHRDLQRRIDTAIKYSVPNDELHDIVEQIAEAYETGEGRDLHYSIERYRRMYPKPQAKPKKPTDARRFEVAPKPEQVLIVDGDEIVARVYASDRRDYREAQGYAEELTHRWNAYQNELERAAKAEKAAATLAFRLIEAEHALREAVKGLQLAAERDPDQAGAYHCASTHADIFLQSINL